MPKKSETTKRSRQPDHEGTPQRLPSGKIRYMGTVTGRKISGPAKETAKEAKAAYRLLVEELLAPRPKEPVVDILFEDFMYDLIDGVFWERCKQDLLSPKTWALYEQIYRINMKASDLGQKPLTKIVPADIERWVSKLQTLERTTGKGKKVFPSKPMAASSKRRYLGVVHTFLEFAVKNEKLIPENPAIHVPKPDEGPSTSRALTGKEVKELLELCQHEQPINGGDWRNRRRTLIVLLGLHGFGPAEISGLQYGDFDGRAFFPHRQAQRFRTGGIVHRERLKTKARFGRVPARKSIIDLLDPTGEGWIITTESGGPTDPGNIRTIFKRMVCNTKFADVTPYDLRHTFANELLQNGVDVKTAADLMRHSVETFLRRYIHGNETLKDDAISKLEF